MFKHCLNAMFNDMNFWDFSRYFQFQPNVNSINWIGIQAIEGCLIWLQQTNPIETDRYDSYLQVWVKASQSYYCHRQAFRLSHITANSGSSVSIIWYDSYQIQRYTSRLTHIGHIWAILTQSYWAAPYMRGRVCWFSWQPEWISD